MQDAGKDMAREEKVKRQKHLGRYFLVQQQLRSASKMWVSPTKIREFINETQCQLTKNKCGGITNTNDVEKHLKMGKMARDWYTTLAAFLSEWL